MSSTNFYTILLRFSLITMKSDNIVILFSNSIWSKPLVTLSWANEVSLMFAANHNKWSLAADVAIITATITILRINSTTANLKLQPCRLSFFRFFGIWLAIERKLCLTPLHLRFPRRWDSTVWLEPFCQAFKFPSPPRGCEGCCSALSCNGLFFGLWAIFARRIHNVFRYRLWTSFISRRKFPAGCWRHTYLHAERTPRTRATCVSIFG